MSDPLESKVSSAGSLRTIEDQCPTAHGSRRDIVKASTTHGRSDIVKASTTHGRSDILKPLTTMTTLGSRTCARNESTYKTNSRRDSTYRLAGTHVLPSPASNINVRQPTYTNLTQTHRWITRNNLLLKQNKFKIDNTKTNRQGECKKHDKSPTLSRYRRVNTWSSNIIPASSNHTLNTITSSQKLNTITSSQKLNVIHPSATQKAISSSTTQKPTSSSATQKTISSSSSATQKTTSSSATQEAISSSPSVTQKPTSSSATQKAISSSSSATQKAISSSSSATQKPTSSSATQKAISSSSSATQKAISSSATQKAISSSSSATQKATSSSATQKAISSSATQKAISSSATQKPISSSATQKPISSSATQKPITSSATQKPISSSATQKPINSSVTIKSKFKLTRGSHVSVSSKSTSVPLAPSGMLRSMFNREAGRQIALSEPPLRHHAQPVIRAATRKSKYKLSRSPSACSDTEFRSPSPKMHNEPSSGNSGSRPWQQRSRYKLLVKNQVQASYIDHGYKKHQTRLSPHFRYTPHQHRHSHDSAAFSTLVPQSSYKSYSSFKLVKKAIRHSNYCSKRKLVAMNYIRSHDNVTMKYTRHRFNTKIRNQRKKSDAWTRKYSLKHAHTGEGVNPFVLRRTNIGQSSRGTYVYRSARSDRLQSPWLPVSSQARTKLDRRKTAASRVIQKSIHAAHRAQYKKSLSRKLRLSYCLYYNRFGRCHRGNKCQHIHDPARVAVCTRFLRGRCRVEGCPFSHKVSKEMMPVCQFFLRGVCCRDNCPYLHNKVNTDARICEDFAQGKCHLGDKCKKKHSFNGKRQMRKPEEKSECTSSPNKILRPNIQGEEDVISPGKSSTLPAFITIATVSDAHKTEAENTSGVLHIRPRLSKL